MSTDTPESADDPEGRPADEGGDGSDLRPGTDEEPVVVVLPERVYERLRSEFDDLHDRRCPEYEDLLAERARLTAEVERLERRLRRTESRLDAVVEHNERILAARTESYRERIAEAEDDDVVWTGRRQESGLVARLRNRFR